MRIDRLIILSILVGCKAATPTSIGTYSEDLTIHRPVSAIEMEGNASSYSEEVINEEYQKLEGHIKDELDSIAVIAYSENMRKPVDGFVIQVYSGNSRDAAYGARTKMRDLFPDLDPKITYVQPSFRVKAGRFTDRLDAHRVYRDVKEEFPRALLVPERFKPIDE